MRKITYTSAIIYMILLFTFNSAIGQQITNLKIKFDKNIIPEDLVFLIQNGVETRPIKIEIKPDSVILIKQPFYSPYATIIIDYKIEHSFSIFINEKPASITLSFREGGENPDYFSYYNEQNIQDVFNKSKNKIFNELANLQKVKYDETFTFYSENSQKLREDSTVRKQYIAHWKDLNAISMRYLSKHPNEYFSFYYMINQASNIILTYIDEGDPYLDTLISYIKDTFPPKFISTQEGETILNRLTRKLHPMKVGFTIPNFEFKTSKNENFNIHDFYGKITVIDFWATWCAPCIKQLPLLTYLRETYPTSELEIISISRDNDFNKWNNFIKKKNMAWINSIDIESRISNLLGIQAIPQVLILDKKGTIVYRDIKVPTIEELNAIINASL